MRSFLASSGIKKEWRFHDTFPLVHDREKVYKLKVDTDLEDTVMAQGRESRWVWSGNNRWGVDPSEKKRRVEIARFPPLPLLTLEEGETMIALKDVTSFLFQTHNQADDVRLNMSQIEADVRRDAERQHPQTTDVLKYVFLDPSPSVQGSGEAALLKHSLRFCESRIPLYVQTDSRVVHNLLVDMERGGVPKVSVTTLKVMLRIVFLCRHAMDKMDKPTPASDAALGFGFAWLYTSDFALASDSNPHPIGTLFWNRVHDVLKTECEDPTYAVGTVLALMRSLKEWISENYLPFEKKISSTFDLSSAAYDRATHSAPFDSLLFRRSESARRPPPSRS